MLSGQWTANPPLEVDSWPTEGHALSFPGWRLSPRNLRFPSTFFLSRWLLKLNLLMALFPGWETVLEDVSQQSPKVRPIVSPVVPGGKGANPVLQVRWPCVLPPPLQGVLLLGGRRLNHSNGVASAGYRTRRYFMAGSPTSLDGPFLNEATRGSFPR